MPPSLTASADASLLRPGHRVNRLGVGVNPRSEDDPELEKSGFSGDYAADGYPCGFAIAR